MGVRVRCHQGDLPMCYCVASAGMGTDGALEDTKGKTGGREGGKLRVRKEIWSG